MKQKCRYCLKVLRSNHVCKVMDALRELRIFLYETNENSILETFHSGKAQKWAKHLNAFFVNQNIPRVTVDQIRKAVDTVNERKAKPLTKR